MNIFTDWLDKTLMPISTKLSENKYLSALQDGLMFSMPILIVGSICIIIGDFPLPIFQETMTSLLGDIWGTWCWDIMVPATTGLVSLLSIIGIANSLAIKNKVESLSAVGISLSAYFILLAQMEDGGFAVSNFEAQGLFTAMITALVATSIYSYVVNKNWIIRMPESVPSFVARSFNALIPAAVTLPIFLIVRILVSLTPYGTVTSFVIQALQMPLANITTSLIGTLFASFLNSFIWFFGIHGSSVVDSFMDPIWYATRAENLAIYQTAATAVRPYIVTMDFINFFVFLTGSGITLPLTIIMAYKCKSKRLKQIGKLSILPGIFNVNEPVIFGMPIVLNPMMLVPFVLAPTCSVLIAYLSMYMGLVPYPTGVTIPWTTPAPIAGWLMCNDWRGGLLQIVVLIVSGLIYYPFIKSLDKKYIVEENEEKK
ncbi:MAG: PTS sugar transporter subunit IIC [Erysipelotrichales bacterium]|nr:PTS sugar transporter subunit IIC [Erysipelotrichales bacterium]